MKQIKLLLTSLILVFMLAVDIYSQETDSSSLSHINLQLNDFHKFAYNGITSNKIMMNAVFAETKSNDSLNSVSQVKKKKSIEITDVIYFAGTVAIAAIVYFLWPEDKATTEENLTFGKPPHP